MNKHQLYDFLQTAHLPTTGKSLYSPYAGWMLAWGDTLPVDATAGYAPGCIFVHNDGATASTMLYVNVGTKALCNFDAVYVGLTATAAELNVLSGITASVAELNLNTGQLATAAEVNRAADCSTRIIATTATTLAITAASHGSKIIVVNSTAACAITLPQATGTGEVYTFVIGVAATATAHTIKVANATDVMAGHSFVITTTATNCEGFATSATSDTITINGTTQGGVAGDRIVIQDVATGLFQVEMYVSATGTEATPFSASVS